MKPTTPCSPSLPQVAAALTESLTRMRQDTGRPLSCYDIYAAMREIAGAHLWDAMPVSDSVGVVRLMWMGGADQAEGTRYLLVTFDGQCFVEGVVPTGPREAADYLMIRRRYLAAHPDVDVPLPGSLEAMRAHDDYEAMTDSVASAIASLVPLEDEGSPTLH